MMRLFRRLGALLAALTAFFLLVSCAGPVDLPVETTLPTTAAPTTTTAAPTTTAKPTTTLPPTTTAAKPRPTTPLTKPPIALPMPPKGGGRMLYPLPHGNVFSYQMGEPWNTPLFVFMNEKGEIVTPALYLDFSYVTDAKGKSQYVICERVNEAHVLDLTGKPVFNVTGNSTDIYQSYKATFLTYRNGIKTGGIFSLEKMKITVEAKECQLVLPIDENYTIVSEYKIDEASFSGYAKEMLKYALDGSYEDLSHAIYFDHNGIPQHNSCFILKLSQVNVNTGERKEIPLKAQEKTEAKELYDYAKKLANEIHGAGWYEAWQNIWPEEGTKEYKEKEKQLQAELDEYNKIHKKLFEKGYSFDNNNTLWFITPIEGYYWVRQGSMQGYVDESGEWFYRESVYQTLDD